MGKVVSVDEAARIARKIRTEKKRIVLVGGCFDILHIGHIRFLEEAKKAGGALFVFLESDETIKRIKGLSRPINTQEDRAGILAAIAVVDVIIMLPPLYEDREYDRLVIQLKPAIIATTKGDLARAYKERAAKLVGAKVIDVVNQIANRSTSKLVEILDEI